MTNTNDSLSIPNQARVVIIGGGVVGASCLYHLAKAGWTDCVLLEKNELTSGSTWHAAGNIPTFSGSWAVMNMQRYSTELYRELGELVDYPMNYHVTGSVRLAHSKERMMEFERALGMARAQNIEYDMMSLDDLKEAYPFIETHDLEGALYDPTDGDIDPAQLTQALAKGARDMGAKIIRFCPVTDARRENDEWVIETEKGEIRCEYVVNAAGYRAQEVGKMFGRNMPMMTMSHQYILFEDNDKIKEWSTNASKKLPLLRDVDSSYYLRQEKYGMNLGPYENNCRAHWHTADDPMPEDFSFQLYPDDLERIEWHLNDAMERVPILGECGLSKVINGPIPYTPDGHPLIGPMPGVPNAFEAAVFTFGICQGGGAGKVLTEWITEGTTEWDMWACDPRRFTDFTKDQDYCTAKGMEVYGHEYAIHFPHHEWPAARNMKLSPVHDKVVEQGAVLGAYNGWERANYFAHAGDDTSEEATFTWDRKGPWYERVREECHAVRDAVGILDLPGFSRFEMTGENVADWLKSLITGIVPKVGRVGLGYFADQKGRLVTEMSIIHESDDRIVLITAATAQWHDKEWLERHMPKDGSITLNDLTNDYDTQIVTGPKSRDLFADICEADLSLPWLSYQEAIIAGKPVKLLRVSYAGELGWEVHSKNSDTPAIYDALMSAGKNHGAKPFGMYALDSLRLEKSYRTWKGDLSTDYTILESGLERFINWNKGDFLGREALEAEKTNGVKKSFVSLIVEGCEYDAPYMSNLWAGDKIIGETTSSGYGHRVEQAIALGSVASEHATAGTELEIEIFNKRYKAIVQKDEPLWDAENQRLRG
jgi:dimethylglycine dehydrogenase